MRIKRGRFLTDPGGPPRRHMLLGFPLERYITQSCAFPGAGHTPLCANQLRLAGGSTARTVTTMPVPPLAPTRPVGSLAPSQNASRTGRAMRTMVRREMYFRRLTVIEKERHV